MIMTSLSLALGDAPSHGDSLQKLSFKDCEPEKVVEQSLQSLHVSMLASQLADPNVFVPMDLAAFVPALARDAEVSICVVLDVSKQINLQPVHTAFLLAGLQQTTESKRADGSIITWTATKLAINTTNNAVRLSNKVFAINDNVDDDDEIDEENLLLSDDAHALLAVPPAMSAVKRKGGTAEDDCGGREPCENCSCGRAAGSMMSNDDNKTSHDHRSSNCGKCALGDAFRCASCPHLGKPAWKPGEEHLVLSLDLQDDF